MGMDNDASSSISHKSGGVLHPPEADIESIRQLLSGYGSSSILKELIQNAEDAEASRMDVFYVPGDPTAHLSLLKEPALLVANNGIFTEEHRDAIRQISLGTKGTEDRSIGRFGKGLKSVFAWCEAFFIIARTDPKRGWTSGAICDFFNPWFEWRHREWDEEFKGREDSLVLKAEPYLSTNYPEGTAWLALWFPLRRRNRDSVDASEEWIWSDFPGDDSGFYQAIRSNLQVLAPSLASLRNLQQINLIDCTVDPHDSFIFEFSLDSQRIPPPNTVPGSVVSVDGMIDLRDDKRKVQYQYCGLAGRLRDEEVSRSKGGDDWPKVVDRKRGQRSVSLPIKGEPHFATLISSRSLDEHELGGTVEVRWCVFFPVGKQPSEKSSIKLGSIRSQVTINLHGFFFLDPERLRIDGLEDRFDLNGAKPRSTSVEWNRIVAVQGTLARLPEAVSSFAKQESFNNLKCRELAGAIRQTWVWSTFGEAICHLHTWRPRWRSGIETWECLSAEVPVFFIPAIGEAREVLACVPMLAQISERYTLIANTRDGSLPGLHAAPPNPWPESLVLELLEGIRLGSTGDEIAVAWINSFLNYLHEYGFLTEAIRDHASVLPLLPVREARTNASQRVSCQEWQESIRALGLFAPESQSSDWARLLCATLPGWSCYIAGGIDLPLWFTGVRPPLCDASKAAKIVLTQTTLGGFVARTELVEAFASQPRRDLEMCLAMRFVLHGEAPRAKEGADLLFLPSTHHGQQIWSRLIEQLLNNDGGSDSWRLLHHQWAPLLSPQLARELNISTIDADGAWEALAGPQINLHDLEFSTDRWPPNDVYVLIQGLFQSAQSRQQDPIPLLRKLRLHTLRGHPNRRVSVADGDGQLADGFVLDKPNFESGLPGDLLGIWQKFLAETKVVMLIPQEELASSVQEQMFQKVDTDGGSYLVELDWNFIVRRSLESDLPSDWAPLMMEALSRQGSQAVRGVGRKFRDTEWLPLALGGAIAPEYVVQIEGLEEDLHRLLDATKDGWASVRALPEWVSSHTGFATLRNLLPGIERAIEALGLWLEDKSEWHLGLCKQFDVGTLEPIVAELEDFESLPAAALLAKVRRISISPRREESDSLLTKFILPSVLKAFDYEDGGVARIEAILRRLQGTQSRKAFNEYLAQACHDGLLTAILPRLSLVNHRDKWVPATQLIWPSSNLDESAQLCAEQSEILAPLHEASVTDESEPTGSQQTAALIRENQLIEAPDFEAEADKLSRYLQPFRIGNVGENLPAALVAVLAGHEATQRLLRELLQSALRMHPEDLLAQLLGDRVTDLAPSVNSERFLIETIEGNSCQVASITGHTITVGFTKEIRTLIVGDPAVLWRRHYYQSRSDTACHLLRLRWIEKPDDLSDWVGVFASTIETILLKVHCNGVTKLCPTNIKEVLGEVADAGQADLRRSQSYLLDMAEARLRELGVKNVPQFNAVLRKFEEARDARVAAEQLINRSFARAKERDDEAKRLVELAKRELRGLLESPEQNATQRTLVDAVRRKMSDFQYSTASVAFELFQNADDAVAELEEMEGSIDRMAQQFVLGLNTDQTVLEIFHWGRPINRHECPGFHRGIECGYDQDLQKMLTLNFSDKGVTPNDGPAIVTGRFGLGFKSVFFVSEQPEVISGRLAFEIRGGFFPVALCQSAAEEMREKARKLGGPGLAPTAIRLKWTPQTQSHQIVAAIDDFTAVAPLLTIFSRRIRTLVVGEGAKGRTWTNTETNLTRSGRTVHSKIGNTAFLCFRCSLSSDERPATVLFQLEPSGVVPLPDNLTGLWITTPTAARSDLKYALNAPFKPDAGRQQLALNNRENRTIATEVARAWQETLIELFDKTGEGWEQFADIARFHSSVDRESLWRQLWTEVTRSLPVVHWESIQGGGQILSWIAWGKSVGAMRGLLQQKPVIPSGLPGRYMKMLMQQDVRFCVVGLLASIDNGCFGRVSQWDSTNRSFPAGQTVAGEIGDFLQLAECGGKMESVTLERVLAAAVGPKNQVDHLTAENMGTLLTECETVFGPRTAYPMEVQQLSEWMKGLVLPASDGSYRPANELLCSRKLVGVVEQDEALRSAFAPDSAILSTSYSERALIFFARARERLSADATRLATWILECPLDKLPAVFKYLIEGELSQQLADQLRRPWLEANQTTIAWQNLSPEDQSEVGRKFLRGCGWTVLPLADISPKTPEITQVMDKEVAFALVSDWWREEQAQWVKLYEDKTYPTGFPGALPWPEDDEWDKASQPSAQARWLMIFIHAALVPLGFNKIGRDQRFSRFLVSQKWLDIFVKVSDKPEALLSALDDYLGGFIENTEYHFQMRQFVAFYAVARNLEDLVLSLREADRSDIPGSFRLAFGPRANPALTGTGIDAPPLTGMLGIGSCQLLRELFRLKRLSNPLGYRYAFTPIRKVRRLCMQLFGIDTVDGLAPAQASEAIFQDLRNLGEFLGLDPTFNHCFDLPLQFLAQYEDLRTKVLKMPFEAESADDETLDGAPQGDVIP